MAIFGRVKFVMPNETFTNDRLGFATGPLIKWLFVGRGL